MMLPLRAWEVLIMKALPGVCERADMAVAPLGVEAQFKGKPSQINVYPA